MVNYNDSQAQDRDWVINSRKTTLPKEQIQVGFDLAKKRYRNRIDSVHPGLGIANG